VLFVAAPIWWVPTSWKVSKNPPELHQNYWQFLVGNSFLIGMLAFLAGVAIMLVRRSHVLPRGLSPPALFAHELREHLLVARARRRAETRLEEGVGVGVDGQLGPPVSILATDVNLATEDLELVGSERSAGPADHVHR
jgi:hypothetical protein